MGPRLVDPEDARGRRAARRRPSAPAFADRDLAGARRGAGGGRPRRADGAGPGARLRDGRHLRRRVRGRDAVLLLDLRVRRLAARGAPGRAAGGAGHRPRPGPDRAGDRVRLLRRPGRRRPPPRGLERRHGQLQPRDGLDRLRRVHAPLLRAAGPGERAQHHRVRERRHGAAHRPARPTCCRRSWRSAARRRSTSPRRSSRPGVPLLGSDLEAIDQAEERTRFSALLDRLGIPQPEGGMAESIEEALTLAERIGYPVIVRPSFVIGGLAIDFAYSPEDLARHLAAAAIVDPDRPGPHRPLPRGHRGGRGRRLRRHRRADPGPARARRAGRRPLGRLDRRVPAPAREPWATRT